MGEQIKLYSAAAMFSGREALFNAHLVEVLEEKGYSVFSPQRDGFEFESLGSHLRKLNLPAQEVISAVYTIIYLLDIGAMIPKSDVVVANFDEPVDEGMVVEATYARIMGKPVIGFRTDLRTPFGTISDPLRGVHGFPAYQCTDFILHYMPCKNPEEAEAQMQNLADKIDVAIQGTEITRSNIAPEYALINTHILSGMDAADTLFSGIKDIHSEQGLEEIAQRYVKHRNDIEKILPTTTS